MSRHREALKLIVRVLDEQAAKLVAVVPTGSGHSKVVYEVDGTRRFQVISSSCSDHRAIRNTAADIRRTCRQLRAQP